MEEATVYDTSTLIGLLKSGRRDVKGFTTTLNIIEFPKALELEGFGSAA
jgi:hypothetical protein